MSEAIFRLEGGLKDFEFPTPGGSKVTVRAHYPSQEEVLAAQMAAGIDMKKLDQIMRERKAAQKDDVESFSVEIKDNETVDILAKQAHAAVELACLCIEDIIGFDIKILLVPYRYGLLGISDENRKQIHRTVLKEVGLRLLDAAKPDEEENFPLEPQPTGTI